ncbi:hypothetical protein RIR_jg22413.t1 [Rhizophagus irregularis DAOM 181602=DAOM 197198]|uniref:Retrotransposon gag domain-containing protein n=1 Tax=Rhizophagus irregularis (strain DAOM 197198w) TaxID=1432141 RepID=A0A015K7A1_RHIIW|nr:hypothetical protein RirG_152900 [Rhizophagus irregularis DAOM 197198w]GBC33664.2 hypothetical protein RIR_jg22413.t1 [Rhizophagus irregularis DAOM 181602=DAOM 197198]
MLELTRIKQGTNESDEEYTRRFRSILRIATRGHARSNPTNLNDAVNEAKREEEAKDELLMKTTGLDMKRVGQEKNMEEILKEETNKYKGMNPNYKIKKLKVMNGMS